MRRRKSPTGLIVVLSLGIGALAVIIWIGVNLTGDNSGGKAAEGTKPNRPRTQRKSKVADRSVRGAKNKKSSKDTGNKRPTTSPGANKDKNDTTPNAKGNKPDPSNDKKDSNSDPGKDNDQSTKKTKPVDVPEPRDSNPRDTKPPVVKDPDPNDSPKRPAVPTAIALNEARSALKRTNSAMFRAKQTVEQRKRWVELLLEEANKSVDKPARHYVLLEKALGLSVSLANAKACCLTVELISDHFQVDAPKLKAEALERARQKVETPDQLQEIFLKTEELIPKAITAERFDVAQSLAKTARLAARKLGNSTMQRQMSVKLRELERLKKQYEAYRQARAVLDQGTKDAKASFLAGRYLCLIAGDWKQGLPLLVEGSDESMRVIAQEELKSPSVPADQVKLGDAWLKMSVGRLAADRTAMFKRARFWMSRALAEATGLEKAEIQRKISKIDESLASRL